MVDLAPLSRRLPATLAGSRRSNLAVGVLLGLVGMAFGIWVSRSGLIGLDELDLSGSAMIAILLAFGPVISLTILVHEMGHVVGGWTVGMRFALLVWGPLMVERFGARPRLRRNRSLVMAGGLALCLPRDGRMSSGRWLAYVGGGPLASLATGIGGLALAGLLSGAHAGAAVASVLLGLYGATSTLIAVVTLWPSRNAGQPSDGARLLALLRRDPRAARDGATMAIAGLALVGVRPRDWPADLVDSVDATGQGGLAEGSLGYLAWADRGAPGRARTCLEAALASDEPVTAPVRSGLALEAAGFEVLLRRDAVAARWWLDQAPPSPLENAALRALVVAAVALATEPDAPSRRADLERRCEEGSAASSGDDRARAAWARRAWLAASANGRGSGGVTTIETVD